MSPPPTPIPVHDAGDERLADFVRLTDVNLRRKLDTERGLYLAEGDMVIRRALAAGHRPRALLVAHSRLEDLASLTLDPSVPCYCAPDRLAEAITGFDVHRGVIASMHRPAQPSVAEVIRDARRIVVLEDLTNHTNVGAIFRSVAALGADGVLVTPRCVDPLYRRAVRVSMGTVFQVPWTRIAPWPAAITTLRDHGFVVAALAPDEDAVPLDVFAREPAPRIAIVFGTEMAGLRRRTMEGADLRVRIPMAGGVSSLNVAAASAVALWALRVR